MKNQLQIYPNVSLPTVDVRDVAAAHIQVAMSPQFQNSNQRFILSARSLWYKDIINHLKEKHDTKIRSRKVGWATIKFGTLINPDLETLIPFIEKEINLNGLNELQINYKDPLESLEEMAKAITKLEEQFNSEI